MRIIRSLILLAAILPHAVSAQERGAVPLAELVEGLGVNARVLVIGAHPDDENTQLITWLARGRQVETAYLSLTRGDGGQNLLGDELGEALGAIRTQELLAARRVDGAHQYFTRAYDFGFSKSAAETYEHWPHDSILTDVVTVVRAFKPHVIVAVFSGTPRDGHGHHQVSGLLAREAYDLAADTIRFPRSTTSGLGPWAPLKFYRSSRFSRNDATLSMNVGEYSPLRGRSYSEIASESRSQHKSQAFGSIQRKGAQLGLLRREAARVQVPAGTEQTLFDGIDTSWTRLRALAGASARAAIDSIPGAIAAVRAAYDVYTPTRMLPALGRVRALAAVVAADPRGNADVVRSGQILLDRANRAMRLASGVGMDALVDREVWAAGEPITAHVTLYDRIDKPFAVLSVAGRLGGKTDTVARDETIAPLTSADFDITAAVDSISQPWWLATPRKGDVFSTGASTVAEDQRPPMAAARITAGVEGATFQMTEPVVYRYADPLKGEIRNPLVVVPAISVTVAQPVQYVPAGRAFERTIRVQLRSASDHPRTARVSLRLPAGLTADSAVRTIALPDYAGGFGAAADGDDRQTGGAPVRVAEFTVHGTLKPGWQTITAVAESEGNSFMSGYTLVDYDHIRPQRLFRPSTVALSAVDARIRPGLTVAYVPGVGDNVAPMLQQLGVQLTIIEPDKVASTDLSRFTTIVLGPRAYASSPALVAANPRLLNFARAGGTLVVQYGQYEMANAGIMPYPITLSRPADRVTEEDASVKVLDPAAAVLTSPNRIGESDFANWVQERSLYMPHTHDSQYHTSLAMHDTGEPDNDAAIMVAPLGKGAYVYTTLSLFRQLPAGVPGGARIFLNLLSVDRAAAGAAQSAPQP